MHGVRAQLWAPMEVKPPIDVSDVIRAYFELARQRREPSLLNIRLHLGRGSYSTIARIIESLCLVGRSGRYDRSKTEQRRGRPRELRRRHIRAHLPVVSTNLGQAEAYEGEGKV